MQQKIRSWAVLLLLGAGLPAAASTFVALGERELVAASDAVVRGRVVSVDSFWNDAHTLIVSEAVFEVEKVVVGTPPRYLTVRTAGGTVGQQTVAAIGFPSFHEGERALLFLERDDDQPMGRVSIGGRPEGYRVTGYQLGHYRVFRDREGREIAVPTADAGVRLVSPDGHKAALPRARNLEAFEAELRLLGQHLGRTVGNL